MDVEVVAAWVAAGAAAFSALVNAYITAQGNRHKTEMELLVSAINHFVGGSQERNSGITALRVLSAAGAKSNSRRFHLRDRPRSNASHTWHLYGKAVGSMFYGQVIYILTHGKNRWQAHEIVNLVAMIEWLLNDSSLGLDSSRDGPELIASMRTYADDWERKEEKGSGMNLLAMP